MTTHFKWHKKGICRRVTCENEQEEEEEEGSCIVILSIII